MLFQKKKKEGLPELPPNPNMTPSMHDYNRPLPPIDPMQNPTGQAPTPNKLPTFPDSPSKRGFSQAAVKEAVTSPENPHSGLQPLPSADHMAPSPHTPTHNDPFPTPSKPKVVEMHEWQPEPSPASNSLPQLPTANTHATNAPNPAPMQSTPPIEDNSGPSFPDISQYQNPEPSIPPLPSNEPSESIITPPPMQTAPTPGIKAAPHPASMIPSNKPIFIKIDKFKSARDSLDTVKERLTEVEELLKMIREVKQKEDQELSAWEKEMENIKVRIAHVSSEIFNNAYSG